MNDSKQSPLSYELELYKKLCESESDRRHKFSDKVFKSTTVIASFVGAILWLIAKFLETYQKKCYCLQLCQFALIAVCSVLMLICVVIFFKTLYGYEEKRPDPAEIDKLMTEYKGESKDSDAIITAMNESLLASYKDAAINNSIETDRHIWWFGIFYKIIFVEMSLLIIAYFVTILT